MSASLLTPGAIRVLRHALETNEEIVCEGLACWIGEERFSRKSVNQLLMCLALTDVSDDKGLRRYVVSSTGAAILRRPALAEEVFLAVLNKTSFQVVEDEIVYLDGRKPATPPR